MTTQSKEALQASYDEMLQANRETVGSYTAREIATVQVELLDLELVELNAAMPGLGEQCQSAVEHMRTAQTAYNEAHQALCEATQVSNSAGFAQSNNRDALERATKLRQSLADELEAMRRGVTLKIRE